MKKLGMVVVILTMVAVAIVPALAQEEEAAQEERCRGMPGVPCRVDPESGLYQMLYTVPCAAFYDPSTHCTVDENGLIEKPDGTKEPSTGAGEVLTGRE